MTNLKNLDQLAKNIVDPIGIYCEQLIDLHGDNLKAIIAYGETLEKEIILKKANLNLLLIFDAVSVSTLTLSLNIISKGRKKGIVAPLFLTIEHIKTSTDVFPLEFLEIKENNVVLYGEDVFKTLDIKTDNIRLQCEQELKGKLIKLRQQYLEVGLAQGSVETLILNSFSAFLPVLKSLLRLKNKPIPKETTQIIEDLGLHFQCNTNIWLSIIKDKTKDEKIGGKSALVFFEDYLQEIAKLAAIVDSM